MSDETIARYYLLRVMSDSHGYHPGKLEARVMRHPGRRARLLLALRNTAVRQPRLPALWRIA